MTAMPYPAAQANPRAPSRPPRILIVRIGAMGDILHALPAVAALRQQLPEATIGWAVEPGWLPLLSSSNNTAKSAAGMDTQPLVDQVHMVPTRAWSATPFSRATLASVAALRRELRSVHYDLVLDLQGSIRSAVVARLAGARQVIGPAKPRERPARLLYTDRVHLRAPHVVEQGCELAEAALLALGAEDAAPPYAPHTGAPSSLPAAIGAWSAATTGLQPAPPVLPHDAAAEAAAKELLNGLSGRIALLAPAAGWGAKQWPAEHFGELAARLIADGWNVAVNATGAADSIAAQVARSAARLSKPQPAAASRDSEVASSGNSPQTGQLRVVPCTLAELMELTRRVHLVVGGDTGPVHLAAALGVPTVALFGPTDCGRTGPWPRDDQTRLRCLRHPESHTDHRRHPATEHGLSLISVDEVIAAIDQLFSTATTMED
jgi:heptosyltransferase-1